MDILWENPQRPRQERYTRLTIVLAGGALLGLLINGAMPVVHWDHMLFFTGIGLLGVWANNCRETVLRRITRQEDGKFLFKAMGGEQTYAQGSIESVTLTTRLLKGVVVMKILHRREGGLKTDTYRHAIAFLQKEEDAPLVKAFASMGLPAEAITRKASWTPLI